MTTQKTKTESKFYVAKTVAEMKEKIEKKVDGTKSDVRRKIKKINLETKKVYKGIENDAKLIVEDFIALGKKNLDKLPMKKTIQKKFSAGISAIPSKLNLPSKEEVENLVIGIDGVNKKVDALSKQFATA